jgi:hypothetical protein
MSGSTNNKIKNNNKQITKQYQSDKAFWKYQNYENERKYDDAVLRTELKQAQMDAQSNFKDEINKQQYEYQDDLRRYQFQNEKDAYKQSLTDFDNQVELNSLSGALAQEAEDRSLDESLISRNFALEDQDLILDRKLADKGFDLGDQNRNLRQARSDLNYDISDQNRELDQARANKGFDLGDQNRKLDRARSDMEFGVAANRRKIQYGRKNLTLDKSNNKDERGYLKDTAKNDLKKNSIKDEQLNNDIKFIKNKEGWDLTKADNTYNKAQAPNFVERIDALVKRERATGEARAAGREGLSAEREVTSALAEYGRSQAALVDSLVFAKDDKLLSKKETSGTSNYQVAGKNLDKASNKVDRNQINRTLKRNLYVSRYKDSKLTLAFQEMRDNAQADTAKLRADFGFTKADIKSDKARIKSDFGFTKDRVKSNKDRLRDDFGFTKEGVKSNKNRIKSNFGFDKKEINQDRRKIKTTYDSAKLQYRANSEKIKLDEYAANLAAQGRVLQKPTVPPSLPKPLRSPRMDLPMPLAPTTSPKPIKGALGKTSVWNDVGDGLNVALQVAGLFI